MAVRPAEPTFAEAVHPEARHHPARGLWAPGPPRRCRGGTDRRIVALPLSMAIAIASGVTPDGGFTPPSSAASWCPRSAAAGFRSAGRPAPSSCWWRRPWSSTGWTGCILATMLSGLMLLAIGLPAARHLHQVHPLPGDGRLHRGHRGHHLRQPAQGTAGPDAGGAEPGPFIPQARRRWRRRCQRSISRPSRVARVASACIWACGASGRTGRRS